MNIDINYVGRTGKTIEKRFWEKVDIQGDDDCWEWQAFTHKSGYGSLKVSGKDVRAHRLSYYIKTGYFPNSDEYVCHTCDNPSCVNPKHLFLGSHTDNMRDMINKGRAHDKRGESNPSNKLTEKDVLEIRRLKSLNISGHKIAKMFRIDQPQVSRIVNYKSWSWLRDA